MLVEIIYIVVMIIITLPYSLSYHLRGGNNEPFRVTTAVLVFYFFIFLCPSICLYISLCIFVSVCNPSQVLKRLYQGYY